MNDDDPDAQTAPPTDPLEQALAHIEERLKGWDDDRSWILKAKPPANPNLN